MAESREIQWVIGEGESYGLVFSIRAMMCLRDLWGLKSEREVGERLTSFGEDMNTDVLVDLLYAATRSNKESRKLSREDVLDLVDRKGLAGLSEILPMLQSLLDASQPRTPQGKAPVATEKNAQT